MKTTHLVCSLVVGLMCTGFAYGQPPANDVKPALSGTLKVENITVHYAPSKSDDAKKVAKYLPTALKRLTAHFEPAGLDEFVTGFRCDLFLHPAPNESASESRAHSVTGTTDGTNRTYFAEIHLLTPSAHSAQAKTHVGEAKDEAYFERLVVHEYAAPVLDRITRSKPKGWRFYGSPSWFVEGYEEYLALTCSNEHSRKVTLPKYAQIVRADPQRVRNDFGLSIRDDYLDGSMVVACMHDRYGAAKVQSVLTSPAESFGEAVSTSLGVNLDSFFAAWKEWLADNKPRGAK